MPSPESPNQATAPPGAIFLSQAELAEMLGDFTVQRAVGIMSQGRTHLGCSESIGTIVEGFIRAAMQEPPQENNTGR